LQIESAAGFFRQGIARKRGDRDADVLHAFTAALRRNNDILGVGIAGCSLRRIARPPGRTAGSGAGQQSQIDKRTDARRHGFLSSSEHSFALQVMFYNITWCSARG
jgi:hypothetical protein